MAEADIIAKEMRGMRDLDGVIATLLPEVRNDDEESVASLQQLLNIRYPEARELSIDGSLGPQTMVALQGWLNSSGYLQTLETGARNTVINPQAARETGFANGYIPFQDDMIASTVYQSAKRARGVEEVINEVVGDLSMEDFDG